ncbi:related to Protein phosphatase 2C homolog 5 [Saccharomycodes ludwigii]|uniref:Related to Protein phosphatase 2C homolog 5 n=1 Tax=Saccharomycodes ludwigii TaxID=36035 RepID=A0A376B1V2_9ASCO|nr:related to Protein phosphatase 2C homolog 5 [Saccharomycodes ludwigii]
MGQSRIIVKRAVTELVSRSNAATKNQTLALKRKALDTYKKVYYSTASAKNSTTNKCHGNTNGSTTGKNLTKIAYAAASTFVACYYMYYGSFNNNTFFIRSDSNTGDVRNYSTTTVNNKQPLSPSTSTFNGNIDNGTITKAGIERTKSYSTDTIPILSPDEVEKVLHANEYSYLVDRNGSKIFRFDVSQLPSNNPIEDNHVEQILAIPSTKDDIWFFGIFDGHSGPFTSAKLAKDIVPYVTHYLRENLGSDAPNFENDLLVETALKGAFLSLDNDIVLNGFKELFNQPSKQTLLEKTMPAVSGACCLLSMYDTLSSTLRVALAGDSRALLVSSVESENNNDAAWKVKSLTIDQTGDNIEEIERIRSEHPEDEFKTCIRNGRILGSLQPSRAFGDYRYKIDGIDNRKISDLPSEVKMFLRAPPKNLKTPPYVTAEPVVTSVKIDPSKDKFMVIASDGLFELLSNEEIASLVINWKDKAVNKHSVVDVSPDLESQRPPFRYKSSKTESSDAINNNRPLLQDENIATHIIRNALSCGGKQDYVNAFVSIPSPMSRSYRDDLTVTVVFFGKDEKPEVGSAANKNTGGVYLNEIATTPIAKPKL